MKNSLLFVFMIFAFSQLNAQSVINEILKGNNPSDTINASNVMGCGQFDMMKNINHSIPGYIDSMNNNMRTIQQKIENKFTEKTLGADEVAKIQVVFHVLYNNEDQNIPDSVLLNQIQVLNDCFRRTNADTVNTRPEFHDLVGDSKIEFELASTDPQGNPTNGIVRKYTSVEYFGGVLPYSQGQNQEIIDWINDSLYYNYFRLTKDELGGDDAWDSEKYLNVWIGDLRILEPAFNNFKEIVFFALATPPNENLANWPDSLLQVFNSYEQGVLIHYPTVGANNPNMLPNPYSAYNSIIKSGKLLVHEIGHYLGLRHIWGDGDCSVDDFISDTPNADSDSQWGCNFSRNTCVDNINGIDLPDMVENYMDYSSGSCQNSFTKGQIEFMRYVLGEYRENILSIKPNQKNEEFLVYPNPTSDKIYIRTANKTNSEINVSVFNSLGKQLINRVFTGNEPMELTLSNESGSYIVRIVSGNSISNFKVIKR